MSQINQENKSEMEKTTDKIKQLDFESGKPQDLKKPEQIKIWSTATEDQVTYDKVQKYFTDMLAYVDYEMDENRGIKRLYIEEDKILIRDAREQTLAQAEFPEVPSSLGFIKLQLANAYRAAAIDICNRTDDRTVIMTLAYESFSEPIKPEALQQKLERLKNLSKQIQEQSKDQNTKEQYNKLSADIETDCVNLVKQKIGELCATIAQCTGKEPEDIKKDLDIAKNYGNFNDEHYTIATIIKYNANDYVTIESPIQNNQTINTEEEWFAKLKPIEQTLVNKYKNKMEDGVIQNQLIKVPGLRNAFQTSIVKINNSNQGGDKNKILHTSIRSGTPACLSGDKKSNVEFTQNNMKSLQKYAGGKIQINSLNSRLPFLSKISTWLVGLFDLFHKDTIIINTLNKANKELKDANIQFSINAFNDMRRFGINDRSSMLKWIKEVEQKISQVEQNISQEIKSPNKKNSIVFQYQDLKSESNLPKITEKCKKVRELIKAGNGLKDKENASLQITTEFSILTDLVRAEQELKDHHITICNSCKSGKDRTGLNNCCITDAVIRRDNQQEDTKSEILQKVVNSGHAGYMAGGLHSGGSGIGTGPTKSENKAGFPSRFAQILNKIVGRTSKLNTFKDIKCSTTLPRNDINSLMETQKQEYEKAKVQHLKTKSQYTLNNTISPLGYNQQQRNSNFLE